VLDSEFAEVVAGQAGVASRAQVHRHGLTDGAIHARLANGRWRRLHPGTYLTHNGPITRPAQLWAALLYCGVGAILSHQTAGELAGLVDQPGGAIHLTVPTARQITRRPGLVIHRSTSVERVRCAGPGLPRSRIEETVVDLAACSANPMQAAHWVLRACGRRLTTVARLGRAVAERGRLRWRGPILAALADAGAGCESVLEQRYLHLVERRHRLPTGRRQARARSVGQVRYDDVRYEPWGVAVELDGWLAHPIESRLRDLNRDNATLLTEVTVLRFGWTDVTIRPCEVTAQVVLALRVAGWTGSPRPCGRSAICVREIINS